MGATPAEFVAERVVPLVSRAVGPAFRALQLPSRIAAEGIIGAATDPTARRKIEEAKRFRKTQGRNPSLLEMMTDVPEAATPLPWGIRGATQILMDPLNYIPGVGFTSTGRRALVTGAKAGAVGAAERTPADPAILARLLVKEAAEPASADPATIARLLVTEPGAPVPPGAGTPPGAGAGAPTSGEEFAANIRLSKYPEDVRSTIKEWAGANPEQVQMARRGVRPDAQVLADARTLTEEMGGDFAQLQRRWKPGEAWNAEEVLAIRGTLRAKTGAVMEAAKVVQTEGSAASHAKLLVALEEQARVQGVVHGVTAEAGRALRSFRQEAFEPATASNAQKMEELLRRVGIGKSRFGYTTKEVLGEIAGDLAALDVDNPVAVNDFIRNVVKPGRGDYINELYINSLLSGPKTHIINAISNTINTLMSPLERGVAAGVESVLAPLQRRAPERFFAEVPADVFGAFSGIQEGSRTALYTLRNGISPGQASKWEFQRTAFRGKLGRIIRAPTTTLEAADNLNYSINYRAALNALALRRARGAGLRGQPVAERMADLLANPPADLLRSAAETAEYRLFRNDPGAFANWIMQGRERFPILRFVIPFIKTPANLLKYGLARSPAGFFNPSLRRNLMAKNPEAADQIARAMIGSVLAASVAVLFGQGKITGQVPKDAAARDRFYREGKMAYSVRIGDQWVQYQRLEAFNQPLSQVATVVDAINARDKTANEKVAVAIQTLVQNLGSQNYMAGLNNVVQAIEDPDRYGSNFLSRFAASAVPHSSLLRSGAQVADPTFRRPRTFTETLAAGLPGASKTVPPIITAFGEESQRGLTRALSPIQVSPAQQSRVDAGLERLGMEVGFVGKTIKGVELTREEQEEYQRLAGQETYKALDRFFGSRPNARGEAQKKLAEKAVDEARERARTKLWPKIRLRARKEGIRTPVESTLPGWR